jgi:hypothetical protein
MSHLALFSPGNILNPGITIWRLGKLDEFRDRQELAARQTPQRLKTTREVALSEGPVSGNRLAVREGRVGQREGRRP